MELNAAKRYAPDIYNVLGRSGEWKEGND